MTTIIPAIDIIGGRCVRLSQGDYASCKVYDNDPVAVAMRFADAGFRRLHVVDLDGAKSAGVVNIGVLEKICLQTSLSVDFGGGIKSDDDIRKVFSSGADYACVGSLAVTNPSLTMSWMEKYEIILSADVRGDGIVRTRGWLDDGGLTLDALIEMYGGHLKYIMCTDIDRDGMLTGPAVDLYRHLMTKFPELQIIASGGVGSMKDIEELRKIGVSGIVVGKAIYENKITLNELI